MLFNTKRSTQPEAGFEPLVEKAALAEVLLRSSAQLLKGRSELEVIRGVCQALTQATDHIRLAWTWFGPAECPVLSPQVYVGPAAEYAAQLQLNRNLLTQFGPAFSMLEGKSPKAFSVSQFSPYYPWRRAAKLYNIRHVLALPLSSTFKGYSGIFVLYADRRGYFDDVGLDLFAALAELFAALLTVAAERTELQHAAYHDALTGLLNRHAVGVIDQRLLRTSIFDPASAVLLLDVDRFKSINDQFGHEVGDQVLQAVTGTLRHTLRRGDEIFRWGGEEFMVCLPHTSVADAVQVAEKLRLAVERITYPAPLSVSVGVAEIPLLCHIPQAVALADKALLQAKSTGRNRVCVHE